MRHATPGVAPVIAEYLTVAYEPASGRVVHLHRTVVLEGGSDADAAARRDHALAAMTALAGDRGVPAVEVAEVDPADHRPGRRHRFDLATRTLIALPRPAKA